MKQWLILSSVICLFLLVWGTVIYQIFFKKEEALKFVRDLPSIHIEHQQKELNSKDKALERESKIIEETQTETEKKYTKLNKRTNPPLHQGIDYGEGISIDDLLKSYGIAMNNK